MSPGCSQPQPILIMVCSVRLCSRLHSDVGKPTWCGECPAQPQPGALCCFPPCSKVTPSFPFASTESMLPSVPGAVEAVPSPDVLQEPDLSATKQPWLPPD